MWNNSNDVDFYELLIKERIEESGTINKDDVVIERLCRTCLKKTSKSDNLLEFFKIGTMNINLDGKCLRVLDMLEEVTGQCVDENDELPHKICTKCMQIVSNAYFFRHQSSRAKNVLIKVIHMLKGENNIKEPENSKNKEFNKNVEIEPQFKNICEHKDSDEEILQEVGSNSGQYSVNIVEIFDENELVQEQEKETATSRDTVLEFVNRIIEVDEDSISENEGNMNSTKQTSSNSTDCEESFISNKNIEEHYDFHPKNKPFSCDVCNECFTVVQDLNRHYKIHKNQTDVKYRLCTFCEKKFIRTDDLKRHIRVHTNEKPYECSICFKRYKQTSDLKEHILTHSNDRKFNCSICGKKLQTRYGLYLHLKVHENGGKYKCKK